MHLRFVAVPQLQIADRATGAGLKYRSDPGLLRESFHMFDLTYLSFPTSSLSNRSNRTRPNPATIQTVNWWRLLTKQTA